MYWANCKSSFIDTKYIYINLLLYFELFFQFEEIVLTVSASDPEPTHKSEVPVRIKFTDQNSALPPVWDEIGGVPIDDYQDLEVYENVMPNDVLEVILKANLPSSATVNYFLPRGRIPLLNKNRNFDYRDIDGGEMEVYNLGLSYEVTPEYILKLRASVSEPHSGAHEGHPSKGGTLSWWRIEGLFMLHFMMVLFSFELLPTVLTPIIRNILMAKYIIVKVSLDPSIKW